MSVVVFESSSGCLWTSRVSPSGLLCTNSCHRDTLYVHCIGLFNKRLSCCLMLSCEIMKALCRYEIIFLCIVKWIWNLFDLIFMGIQAWSMKAKFSIEWILIKIITGIGHDEICHWFKVNERFTSKLNFPRSWASPLRYNSYVWQQVSICRKKVGIEFPW